MEEQIIFVLGHDGQMLQLSIQKNDKFKKVTKVLGSIYKLRIEEIILRLDNQEIDPELRIEEVRFENNMIIMQINPKFTISIATSNKNLIMDVNSQETILNIKKRIEKRWRVPHQEIILSFQGNELRNEFTTQQSEISSKNNKLDMVVKSFKFLYQKENSQQIFQKVVQGLHLIDMQQDPDFNNPNIVIQPKL